MKQPDLSKHQAMLNKIIDYQKSLYPGRKHVHIVFTPNPFNFTEMMKTIMIQDAYYQEPDELKD